MSKKILIVDDDAATLQLLQSFLGDKGFDTQTAQDGVEGLAKAKKWSPDLVLLDVMMPKLDGYGFVREIKKDPELRRVPIVVLTAREMMRDVFVQEGIKDYVIKPYQPEELYKIVLNYF